MKVKPSHFNSNQDYKRFLKYTVWIFMITFSFPELEPWRYSKLYILKSFDTRKNDRQKSLIKTIIKYSIPLKCNSFAGFVALDLL